MHTAPASFLDVSAGDPRKVTIAQVLVYELRVRDAMSKLSITATPLSTFEAAGKLWEAGVR